MGKLIPFKTGIPYVSDGLLTEAMPIIPISKIIVKHRSTTPTGGTAGDYVADTLFKYVKLTINSKEFEDWNGDAPADEVAYGLQALRKLNQFVNHILEVSEYTTIDLPDATPENVQAVLRMQFNPIASINDGNRTAYAGTVDLFYESEDKQPGNWLRKVINNKEPIGTSTSKTFYLDATEAGFTAGFLILYNEDNGTALSEAEAKLLEIEISQGSNMIWAGKYIDLIAETSGKAGVSFGVAEGWALLKLGNIVFKPQELKVVIRWASAQTDHNFHYWIVQYAKL